MSDQQEPSFKCNLCNRTFARNFELNRHKNNRKTPCNKVSMEQKIQQIMEEKMAPVVKTLSKVTDVIKIDTSDINVAVNNVANTDVKIDEKANEVNNTSVTAKPRGRKSKKSDIKPDAPPINPESNDQTSIIINLVDTLHNLIRNRDHKSGIDAYYDVIRLLFLKFIQPELTGKLATLINPSHYRHHLIDFQDSWVSVLDFNNLANSKSAEHEFKDELDKCWDMLSMHPFTKNVFVAGKSYNCSVNTIRECIYHIDKVLKETHFMELDHDIKGIIYEHFVNGYANNNGKEFGQFFTPRNLIKLIFKLNKEVYPEHAEVKAIYDPCCGTAGFLTEAYKEHKSKNNTLDAKSICGHEIHDQAFLSATMNTLLTLGDITNIQNTDSLKDNANIKYDHIITNPPFGTKNNYNELLLSGEVKCDEAIPLKKGEKRKAVEQQAMQMYDMYPINTNKEELLFLHHCISKLAQEGLCNIVVPDGMTTNAAKADIQTRKRLVETCKLRAVLSVPNGTFTHAGVATKVLFFTKHETEITDNVKFYETDKTCLEFRYLGDVTIEELQQNNYVLSYKRYTINNVVPYTKPDIKTKTIGEICELVKGQHSSTRTIISDNGHSKFITVAFEEKWKHCNIEDGKEASVFVSNVSSGNVWPLHYYEGAYAYCSLLYKLHFNNTSIIPKYIYYYLKHNVQQNIMNDCVKGTANKSLDIEVFNKIPIPIPPKEIQEQIVEKCDAITQCRAILNQSMKQLQSVINIYNDTYIKQLMQNTDNVKTIGEICDINFGTRITQKNNTKGIYKVYGGGDDTFTTNSFNRDGKTCKISRFAISEHNCVQLLSGPYYLNDSGLTIQSRKSREIIDEYIWYYLLINKSAVYNLAEGSGQKNLNIELFKTLYIPTPTLDIQKEIVEHLDKKHALLNSINNDIDSLNDNVKYVLNYYLV